MSTERSYCSYLVPIDDTAAAVSYKSRLSLFHSAQQFDEKKGRGNDNFHHICSLYFNSDEYKDINSSKGY